MFPYFGEILALCAPITWSFSVILFRKTGEHVPAYPFNIFRNLVGLLLFGITLAIFPQGPEVDAVSSSAGSIHWVGWKARLYLMASGIIGIGIADTIYLMALNRVGAGLQAIITTSYSPAIIFLSLLFLGETLNAMQLIGVALILSAVLSVSWMRGPNATLPRRTLVVGTALGVGAMLAQAVSIVMIKPMLEHWPLVWANFWRILGALVGMFLVMPLFSRKDRALGTLKTRRIWKTMFSGTVLGNYVSLMIWLGGMKYTQASTASALNQTSTLWTFLLAAWLLKEPVTWKRVMGLLIGAGGVALVTFG